MIPFRETEFGFDYGAAKITRMCSDEKKGWIILRVETPKTDVQIYVTKTGKVRVCNEQGELKNG